MNSNIHSNSYQDCYPTNVPLYSLNHPFAIWDNAKYNVATHNEEYRKGATERFDKTSIKESSLLMNVLIHGKETVKQSYNAVHSHTNVNTSPPYQTIPNGQINSHNSHKMAEILVSKISPVDCEKLYNLLRQPQQQEYNQLIQNYPANTMQSHNNALLNSGLSTIPTQCEQNKTKQQTDFNVHASQVNSYNNIRKDKNVRIYNHNNDQSGLHTNNVAKYPWMDKRTRG